MEKMVTERLMYFIESRDVFSLRQSGFRKGINISKQVNDYLLIIMGKREESEISAEEAAGSG